MIRRLIISILLSFIYWLPATIVLNDIITNDGIVFPNWIDTFLMPGYVLGLMLGFLAGNFAAFIGQIITLAFLSTIIFGLLSWFKRYKK